MKNLAGGVDLHRRGDVALVAFNRPPNNFVSLELITSLADALEAVDADPLLRASVLTSGGRVFCAGADLASPSGIGGSGMAGVDPLYTQAARLFAARKPIIAAIQGAAVGAGLGLALVADFRVAAPEARFVSNFVKLGFHPGFGITHTLPRLIGAQRAHLMCLTGRRIKAEEALVWGLVDQVVPAGDLASAAFALAGEIAANAPLAVDATRATLRAGLLEAVQTATAHELAEQTRLRTTADFAEGVLAVNERRPGRFVGA